MLGAILGDIIGSPYEWSKPEINQYKLMHEDSHLTDDSLLTIEVARTLLNNYPLDYSSTSIEKFQKELVRNFSRTWNNHKEAGWGGAFYQWADQAFKYGYAKPYGSYGNGGAMRVSPVGWIAKSPNEVMLLSRIVTEVTHNSEEGLKSAECVAMCVFLARQGMPKEMIKDIVESSYYPEIKDLTVASLMKSYRPSVIASGSVPQSIACFLDTESMEEAIKAAVLIGGDTDTQACIAGSIAEAYYHSDDLSKLEEDYLYWMIDPDIEELIKKFYETVGSKKFEK